MGDNGRYVAGRYRHACRNGMFYDSDIPVVGQNAGGIIQYARE